MVLCLHSMHQKSHAFNAVKVVGIGFLKGNFTGERLIQETDHGDERQRVEDAVCHELFFFFKVDATDVSRQHFYDFISDRHIYFGTNASILGIDIIRNGCVLKCFLATSQKQQCDGVKESFYFHFFKQ